MKKRTSVFARLFAALALVAAVLAVVILISTGLKDEKSGKKGRHPGNTTTQETEQPRTKAKTYTVQTGDTLIAIAHKTGVSVAEIQALNPEVDPQILLAGETLKLR